MNQNQSLEHALQASKDTPIETIARFIEKHVNENWKLVLESRREKLMDAYIRAGDLAYGTYGEYLFRPVHRELKQAGLRAVPNLPGKFDISREWGNADETDQQRWMWSTIQTIDRIALGTIVIVFYHDHSQFRVPRKPKVIALAETTKQDVIRALARRSRDFRNAREASIEIAEYLASLEQQDASSTPN